MKISKPLASCLIISCMSVAITSCNSSSSQVTRDSVYTATTTTKSPTPEPVKAPEVYDVICFSALGFWSEAEAKCLDDSIYKVPRNTKVTAHLEQKTSVQQGTNTVIAFKYDRKNGTELEKITVAEMESLASQGANIYGMYRHAVSTFSTSQNYAEVVLFNNKLGKFKVFDRNPNQVVFATGDTKIRYKYKPDAVERFSQRTGLR
jgi:hypothetical protein